MKARTRQRPAHPKRKTPGPDWLAGGLYTRGRFPNMPGSEQSWRLAENCFRSPTQSYYGVSKTLFASICRKRHSATTSGAGKLARNHVEHAAEAVAHCGQGADGGHRNQGSDEAILDGRGAILVSDKRDHLPDHAIHSIEFLGRNGQASSQEGFNC